MLSVPLLCVTGTLCDGRVFAPLLAACGAADATCAVVADPTVGSAADALLATAPERFVAVAFSLGGFVAVELARRAPDRVQGLALLSSNARADPVGNAPARRGQLARFEAFGGASIVGEMWSGCVSPANAARDDVRSVLVEMADATPISRFAAQVEVAISRPDARASLAAMPMPVLAVQGGDDAMSPPDRAEEIVAAAPAGSMAIVQGAGHFAPLEDPHAVADALAAWLAREGLR